MSNTTNSNNATSKTPAIKVITPTVHGVIDYLIVAVFLIAPSAFGLTGVFAYGAYGLAAAHFLLTVTTNFASGLFPILSLRIHALLELLVSLGMVISPWIFQFADEPTVRNFFLFFGIFIFTVWLMTDYGLWGAAESSDAPNSSETGKLDHQHEAASPEGSDFSRNDNNQ